MMPSNKGSITVRVSPEEKKRIEENAEQFGGSISDYVRTILLNPGTDLNGRLAQSPACGLCNHWELIKRVEDPNLRDLLVKWEEMMWQSIK